MTATSPAASPTTSLTARQSQPTSPAARPVFPVASLSLPALEAAMLAAPYGDEFAALVAEWHGRLEWEAALAARVVTGDDGIDHYL